MFWSSSRGHGPGSISRGDEKAALCRRLVLGATTGLLLLGALATGQVDARSRATAHGGRPAWLSEINRYRRAAGVTPVSDDLAWDIGIHRHLVYLARTPSSYETGQYASAHTENPASPYYTKSGSLEAGSSDLITGGLETPLGAVDVWLTDPFHAVGMLRPNLRKVALAVGGNDPGGAGLDVIRGLTGATNPHQGPVLFPGRGVTTDLTAYGDEEPSPTQSCHDGSHDGLPIIILLPSTVPQGVSAELKIPHGTVDQTTSGSLCLVDQHTYRTTDPVYGPTGLDILKGDHAVFLIPRAQLTNGTYQAVVTVGDKHIVWSFRVKSKR